MSTQEHFPSPDNTEDKPKFSYPRTEGKDAHSQRKARWAAIPPDKPLTKRERLFVAEYMVDLNGGAAMRRLGRGGTNPNARSQEMMKRANVAKAIESAVDARAKASEITVEKLEKRWAEYAFAPVVAGPIQHNHVQNALEHLGKLKGAYKPEQQTTIPVVFQFLNGPPLPVETVIEGSARPVQPDIQALGRVLTPPK